MKGYGLLFLLATVVMLLLPLPALPRSSAAPPPPTESTAPSATTTAVAPAPAGMFRVLCGEQVVTLSQREFLIRTLAFEMSPTTHTEALKAQAVAAYTYHSRRRALQQAQPTPALQGADFASPDDKFPGEYTADKLREQWGTAYDNYYQKLCQAVDSVAGYTLTRDGALIDACYFAISNGSTESAATVWGADIPYLQAVASPGDRLAPDYQTTCTLTPEAVRTALAAEPNVALPEDPAAWFGTPTLSAAGTVDTIPVGGTPLRGTRVRELFGLRSATFTVEYSGGQFTFTVRGYGHGVGMSQYGADYLARQGYTFEEILAHYYTGVTLTRE